MRKINGIHEALWAKVQYKVICRKGKDLTQGVVDRVFDQLRIKAVFNTARPGLSVTNTTWMPTWEAIDV